MEIVIIGGGAMGTAMAQELASNPLNQIKLLFRREAAAVSFNKTKINERYFPNRTLAFSIAGISEWQLCADVDIIFLAVPSGNISEVISRLKPHLNEKTLLVNLAKGIYSPGLSVVDALVEQLNHQNTVTLKGPSFSTEMINQQATLLTLGFDTRNQLEVLQKVVQNTNIYLDYTSDIQGVEWLSALKNVYAILLGNIDARFNAANTRFLVLTKAFAEIKLILEHLGGQKETLFLGCGFGDINLTALNDLSRNRTLGLLIGKGFYNPTYKNDTVVLEGVKTLKLLDKLISKSLKEKLPLLKQITAFFIDNRPHALEVNFDQLFDTKYTTVITYGTFDLLHYGHLEILRRAKALGDRLVVGLSSDEFNEIKGKKCEFSFEKRKAYLTSLTFVDEVFKEDNWKQKLEDIQRYQADVFVMGDDWEGKFDNLKEYCKVVYLNRTDGISTTELKKLKQH